MRIQRPSVDLRDPVRWKRGVVIATLFIVPVAVAAWPWSFLPLRWQYSSIREAEPVIAATDQLWVRLGRLPTYDEFLQAADPLVASTLNYEPSADGYQLMIVCGFGCALKFDSRTHRWQKWPTS
ncbi:MAG TPA: hypothetical protein VKQ32_24565 [Polyangia bacterium]|nr:hypothetical protein [Polyangia bacterium]